MTEKADSLAFLQTLLPRWSWRSVITLSFAAFEPFRTRVTWGHKMSAF